MKVQRQNDQVVLRITDDPPENSCRPSVDYLFRSVAEVYGGRAVGVIMTGMGNDGSLGCRRLKHCGARDHRPGRGHLRRLRHAPRTDRKRHRRRRRPLGPDRGGNRAALTGQGAALCK